MKVIIAGSRDFSDYETLAETCDHVLKNKDVSEIVSGTAKGADQLGEKYAYERGYGLARFPADWKTHGKQAGPIRNQQMADYADGLIAFRINENESKGTTHMIKTALKKGLWVYVCEIKNPGKSEV